MEGKTIFAVGMVDALAAYQAEVVIDPGEADVAINAVFPFDLLAIGVEVQVGGNGDRRIGGFFQCVGDADVAAVQAGHDGEIEAESPGVVGDMGDAEEFFGIWPPLWQ